MGNKGDQVVHVKGRCLKCGQTFYFYEPVDLATAHLNWVLREAAKRLLKYFVKDDVTTVVTCKCGSRFTLNLSNHQ